jgi:hypothetical protein
MAHSRDLVEHFLGDLYRDRIADDFASLGLDSKVWSVKYQYDYSDVEMMYEDLIECGYIYGSPYTVEITEDGIHYIFDNELIDDEPAIFLPLYDK